MSAVHLDLDTALRAVRALVPRTPLVEAPALSERLGPAVHLKLENLQVTGSFKVRGAAAHLSALDDEERRRGVVACSSGNHGRAVSWVGRRLGVPVTVYLPAWADPVKREAMVRLGAEVRDAFPTFDEAEAAALEEARASGRRYVSAYDDPEVAAGQGSVGAEIADALPDVGTVVVPLSGGGLAGGIAAALAERAPSARVVAVSAERARVMVESLGAGHPVEMEEEPTLAGALAGGIGLDNRWSFRLVRDGVHDHVLVDEDAIARAMAFAALRLKTVVEGGGVVGLAALLEGHLDGLVDPGRPAVVVLSGGNVDGAVLARVLAEHGPAADGG